MEPPNENVTLLVLDSAVRNRLLPNRVYLGRECRLEDFAPEKLICLAEALRRKYPNRNVMAFIFSSREAALGYVPSIEWVPKSVEYESKSHGVYIYSKEKHEDYLLVVPDALNHEAGSPFDTRIDLPVTGTPVCKLGISGRCLLEFQHIDYPSIDGKKQIAGRVTLYGSIRRDGTLSNFTVVNAKANLPQRESVLVDWTIKNLSTWRFEPGKQEDAMGITYYFEVTDSPLAVTESGVQFRLPSEVRVQTSRAH